MESIVTPEPTVQTVELTNQPTAPEEPVVVSPAPLFHQPEQGDLLSTPLRQHAASTPDDHAAAEAPKDSSPEEDENHAAQRDSKLS
jgi:ribonuclease E